MPIHPDPPGENQKGIKDMQEECKWKDKRGKKGPRKNQQRRIEDMPDAISRAMKLFVFIK